MGFATRGTRVCKWMSSYIVWLVGCGLMAIDTSSIVTRNVYQHVKRFCKFLMAITRGIFSSDAPIVSILPFLFTSIAVLARPQLNETEIKERWSALRSNLADVHSQQHEKSGHDINTLNITAADHAMHKTHTTYNPYIKARVDAPFLLATVNMTHPAPLTLPTQEIAHNIFRSSKEDLVAIPTMRPGQKGPLPLRTAEQRRPLDVYCSYNECSTLGEMQKTVGKRIQRLYHASAPGRVQDRMSASGAAAAFASTRDLTPHELKRQGKPPAVDHGIDVFQGFVDAVTPDQERAITRTATRITRTVVWDNLDLIGPQPDQRMANALAYVHARDMILCNLSSNTLPYCRKPAISTIQSEQASDSEFIDDGSNTTSTSTPTEEISDRIDVEDILGVSLDGIARSCRLQGGCTSGRYVTPAMFDREFLDENFIANDHNEINDQEEPTSNDQKSWKTQNLFEDPSVAMTWPMYFKVYDKNARLPVRGEERWLNKQRRHQEFDFRALVLPKYSNVTQVIADRLPFLFLIDGGKIPVVRGNATDDDDATSGRYDPLNPDNWNKPWLDWRFAFPAGSDQQCIGPYDWEAKLCVSPVAAILRPIFKSTSTTPAHLGNDEFPT